MTEATIAMDGHQDPEAPNRDATLFSVIWSSFTIAVVSMQAEPAVARLVLSLGLGPLVLQIKKSQPDNCSTVLEPGPMWLNRQGDVGVVVAIGGARDVRVGDETVARASRDALLPDASDARDFAATPHDCAAVFGIEIWYAT